MEILKIQENYINVDIENTFFIETGNKNYWKSHLFKYCASIDYNKDTNIVLLKFYNFTNDCYKSCSKILDYYINNPDELVKITLNYSTLENPTFIFKTLTLFGKIDREYPFTSQQDSYEGSVGFLQIALRDVKDLITIIEPAKLTLLEQIKSWFSIKLNNIKFIINKIFPKKDPTLLDLPKTSFISVYTKRELENRLFDFDVAIKISKEDLKNINDPDPSALVKTVKKRKFLF